MQAKSKIINKSKERTAQEIYGDPNTPKEKKLEIMGDEIYEQFGNRARWDIISFDDKATRYEVAEYPFYLQSFLSNTPRREENYIDYLKCYLAVLSDGLFYGEVIPDENEFIKQKCDEAGLSDVFKKYYAIEQAQAIKGDIEKLAKLSECCLVSTLEKIDTIFESNSDIFTLYRCPECQHYWLYHKHEDNWMDNFRFDWDEYQEWYIGIYEADLPKVYEKKFSEITELHGLVYNDTTHHYPERDWRVYWG